MQEKIGIEGEFTFRKTLGDAQLEFNVGVSRRRLVADRDTANAGDMTGAHGYTSTSATTYYVTFQVESGDRMELRLSGTEYGQLAEDDTGKLSFQGTRYLGFERH